MLLPNYSSAIEANCFFSEACLFCTSCVTLEEGEEPAAWEEHFEGGRSQGICSRHVPSSCSSTGHRAATDACWRRSLWTSPQGFVWISCVRHCRIVEYSSGTGFVHGICWEAVEGTYVEDSWQRRGWGILFRSASWIFFGFFDRCQVCIFQMSANLEALSQLHALRWCKQIFLFWKKMYVHPLRY